MGRYLEKRFGSHPEYARLQANVAGIQQDIAEAGPVDVKITRKINKKLNKYGLNREYVPGTKEYAYACSE